MAFREVKGGGPRAVRLPASSVRDPQIWITKDHRALFIKDMEDSHLLNTIVYLNRRAMQYITDSGLSINVDGLLLTSVPQYQTMIGEAVRRGLMELSPRRSRPARPQVAAPAVPARKIPAAYARFAELIFDED